MIEFDKISKIEHLPHRLFDRFLSIPKSDADFLLPMLDGERRSGRTTRLSVFYADMLIERGYVKVLDHFFSEDSREMHECDVRLSKMVIKEMESRGYVFAVPRNESGLGCSFHQISDRMDAPHFVMTTKDDLDAIAQRWRKSIAHCTAFNNFMERKESEK
jgi:hypothetical protein